jgi:hypothetical protein
MPRKDDNINMIHTLEILHYPKNDTFPKDNLSKISTIRRIYNQRSAIESLKHSKYLLFVCDNAAHTPDMTLTLGMSGENNVAFN